MHTVLSRVVMAVEMVPIFNSGLRPHMHLVSSPQK